MPVVAFRGSRRAALLFLLSSGSIETLKAGFGEVATASRVLKQVCPEVIFPIDLVALTK